MTKEEKKEALKKLREKMEIDKTLPLQEPGSKLVFGDGNPDAKIMMIGEGPGYWESQKGLPFVGNAGKLLDFLLHSIEVPRESVFITNVVHYRPPNNRDPMPEELKAFELYLDKMIEIIKPKIIVTLGRFSMGKFLPGVMISSVHGKTYKIDWQEKKIIVVPMYHPAAGLRNGEIKRRLVEDFSRLPLVVKDTSGVESEQMQLV